MKYLYIAAPALLATLCFLSPCRASSVMAVGQDEGYSGKVMDKIIAKWEPPPHLKREYRLKARVGLDGRGRVVECRAQRSSGLEALDASVCAAVRAAAPFGEPPYGMPADIYLSFWTGNPQNHLPPETRDNSHLAEESMAAEARASAMNASAKAKAEQAAKSSGKPLPGAATPAKAASAAPQTAKAPETVAVKEPPKEAAVAKAAPEAGKAAESHKAPEAAKTAPAKTDEKSATAGENRTDAKPAAANENRSESKPAPEKPVLAQSRYDEKFAPYIAKVVKTLRDSMYVPIQTAPGTYYVTAQVNFDKRGKITSCSIIKGGGDDLLDKYVLQGIRRAKHIPPPPPDLGDFLDLTFAMIRQ